MSKRSTPNRLSATEVKCPDCRATLACRTILKRHRRTQHPEGTEVRPHCPYPGCEYETDQKGNLMVHIERHSNEYPYPCQDCGKGFANPSTRIRHRKTEHGYRPYHTPHYYTRRALKEAEMQAKVALEKTDDQKAANVFQNTSSTKVLVDVPHCDGSVENDSQDVQISASVDDAPAGNTPETPRSDWDLSLPKVGHQPVTLQTGPQLDTTV